MSEVSAAAANISRRTFLLTYSQADLLKFPDCESFTKIVLEALENCKSSTTVKEWACCQELHADGGSHYHMAINLSAPRRWNTIKNYIYGKYSISVNFATQSGCGYVAAYRYVSKNKPIEEVLHSANHTNLQHIGSPKTSAAMRKNQGKRQSAAKASAETAPANVREKKRKRLTNENVAKFMVDEKIKTEQELFAIANKRKSDGENDLYAFILAKSPKNLCDLVQTTWRLEDAPVEVERSSKSRWDLIRQINSSGACVEGCGGKWFRNARQVLVNNKVNMYYFACAMRHAIKKGRQKNQNILIVGPTNCGKSFLLNPLEIIYRAFVNPATGKYAWIGLDRCEVAYLNDFRWSAEIIAWSDFLLLLEGQTVHLPRPKNQFSSDMCIERSNTIPFFATSKTDIEFIGKFNTRDERETDMMSSRWNTFYFLKQIENPEHTEP